MGWTLKVGLVLKGWVGPKVNGFYLIGFGSNRLGWT